ncbi:hypothetical protein WMF01_47775 [Sorangium sp. So ce1667]
MPQTLDEFLKMIGPDRKGYTDLGRIYDLARQFGAATECDGGHGPIVNVEKFATAASGSFGLSASAEAAAYDEITSTLWHSGVEVADGKQPMLCSSCRRVFSE